MAALAAAAVGATVGAGAVVGAGAAAVGATVAGAAVGAAAVACGHVYQAPPFRLSYKVSGPLKLCLFLSPIGQ